MNYGCDTPIVLYRSYEEDESEDIQIKAGADFGALLLDGFGNGIMIDNKGNIPLSKIDAYMFGILQAARSGPVRRNLFHVLAVVVPYLTCKKQ